MSDFHRHSVFAVGPDGQHEVAMTVDAQPAGLGWLPDGSLLVASMKDHRLLRQWPDGSVTEHADLTGLCHGYLNDMVVDGEGRAYVGNFGYAVAAGESRAACPLVCVDVDGSARTVGEDLLFSQWDGDNRRGPHADRGRDDGLSTVGVRRAARRFAHRSTDMGATGPDPRTGCRGPDRTETGCCLDAEGHLWVADAFGRRCLRIGEGGAISEEITIPGQGIYACMLGGRDGQTLLMCVAPNFGEANRREARDTSLYTTRLTFPMRGSRDGDPVHPTTPPGRWCTMTCGRGARRSRPPPSPTGLEGHRWRSPPIVGDSRTGTNTPDILRVVANSEAGVPALVRAIDALMYQSELPAPDREAAVLRLAASCRSQYEWVEHEQIARTVGLSAEAIEAIAAVDDRTPIPLLTESQNLVITIVDSTLDAGGPGIDDELWSRAPPRGGTVPHSTCCSPSDGGGHGPLAHTHVPALGHDHGTPSSARYPGLQFLRRPPPSVGRPVRGPPGADRPGAAVHVCPVRRGRIGSGRSPADTGRARSRCAVLMVNVFEHLVAWFAVLRADLVLVPVNLNLAAPKVADQLEDAEASTMAVSPTLVPQLDLALAGDPPAIRSVVVVHSWREDPGSDLARPARAAMVDVEPATLGPVAHHFATDHGDLALIWYTSGPRVIRKGRPTPTTHASTPLPRGWLRGTGRQRSRPHPQPVSRGHDGHRHRTPGRRGQSRVLGPFVIDRYLSYVEEHRVTILEPSR